jgi:hypothetical protein
LRLGARASCPRRRDARETPARRSGSRRQDAHSACPGCARLRRACQRGYASGVQAGETPALHSGSRARDARAPFRFMGACASGAHISSACPGCARLRRAYQQRLPRVRAPLARISAAPALGARASGAQAGETPARRPGVTVALRLGARASCPRRRDAGETPALRAGSWVRAPPARISAAPALGARASGAHASEDTPPVRRRAGRPRSRARGLPQG